MSRDVFRIVLAVGAFVLDIGLRHERSREVVTALFPDDAEWQRFMADPEHSHPLLWEQVTE